MSSGCKVKSPWEHPLRDVAQENEAAAQSVASHMPWTLATIHRKALKCCFLVACWKYAVNCQDQDVLHQGLLRR